MHQIKTMHIKENQDPSRTAHACARTDSDAARGRDGAGEGSPGKERQQQDCGGSK